MSTPPSALATSRTELLLRIAESISGEVGVPFLKALVAALQEAMDVSLVLISVGEGDPVKRARAIFALRDGAEVEDISYDLTGTPCGVVYSGQRIVIPCDLAERFPREEGFSSYVGVPLFSENEVVCGHLAVFSETPIRDPAFAESLVRIFGQRVEAERRQAAAAEMRERLIVDLRESSARLRRRYQALRAANAFKTRLLGMIAHDLRNPLAAITSQAELIKTHLCRKEPNIERAVANADRVVASADRMSARIGSTLQEVRRETSSLSINPVSVDIGVLVSTAVEVNRSAADRKQISISTKDGACAVCSCDEDLLLDAVDNLVSNAIKYSHSGSDVEIKWGMAGNRLCISVRDQGQGLTREDLQRAFQPFQPLSAKPTAGEGSVGLGLSNVREIAEAHGGRVWAESEGKGRGATFHLEIPL